ncbi:hypothetical protein DPMN_117901 [Dreissena polymorpha]|uniref:Uncharacterized protein n=1 Tax=Dreissena polymorpha TaxID=45954 RepID=A0A9D4GFW7_DREPO|nr:hypothetical protein DPMN_117901 [Dreissena polymorpha]
MKTLAHLIRARGLKRCILICQPEAEVLVQCSTGVRALCPPWSSTTTASLPTFRTRRMAPLAPLSLTSSNKVHISIVMHCIAASNTT